MFGGVEGGRVTLSTACDVIGSGGASSAACFEGITFT